MQVWVGHSKVFRFQSKCYGDPLDAQRSTVTQSGQRNREIDWEAGRQSRDGGGLNTKRKDMVSFGISFPN